MRLSVFVLVFAALLSGQQRNFQEREQLSLQDRVDRMEERFAARSEDIKNITEDLTALKTELKTIREQAINAKSLSESSRDRVDQISWIGRLILGAVAFLIGVIVTQVVSKFMTMRRPHIVQTAS